MAIVTFAVGAASRTTENVSAPPLSVVTKPEVGVTVIPGEVVSSSMFVTETSGASIPR